MKRLIAVLVAVAVVAAAIAVPAFAATKTVKVGPQMKFGPTSLSIKKGDTNLMEPIMVASRAYVTMGEMCEALRDVWGIWRETPVF